MNSLLNYLRDYRQVANLFAREITKYNFQFEMLLVMTQMNSTL